MKKLLELKKITIVKLNTLNHIKGGGEEPVTSDKTDCPTHTHSRTLEEPTM